MPNKYDESSRNFIFRCHLRLGTMLRVGASLYDAPVIGEIDINPGSFPFHCEQIPSRRPVTLECFHSRRPLWIGIPNVPSVISHPVIIYSIASVIYPKDGAAWNGIPRTKLLPLNLAAQNLQRLCDLAVAGIEPSFALRKPKRVECLLVGHSGEHRHTSHPAVTPVSLSRPSHRFHRQLTTSLQPDCRQTIDYPVYTVASWPQIDVPFADKSSKNSLQISQHS